MRRFLSFLWLLAAARGAADSDAWTPVPNAMQDGRWAPAAALLPDNHTALIAGGFSYTTGGCVATADRYEESTGRFAPCHSRLTYPRDFVVAAPLPGGTILFAGGFNTILGSLDTAELYDPSSDTFRLLPAKMSSARELFTATALADGRVLLVGGFDTHRHVTQASADLYDPTTQTFTPTGTLSQDRFGHAAVRLADGRVLIVGGKHWRVGQPDRPLASAEIYDPRTGRFHSTIGGDMAVPRDRPTATLLPDDRVLIAGGQNGADGPRLAELFDPRTEKFTPLTASLNFARMAHSDVTLLGGRVLLAGGWSPPLQATTASTETFDPRSEIFTNGPAMPASGHDLAMIAFPDGLVLVAGGKQVEKGHETSLATGAVLRVTVK